MKKPGESPVFYFVKLADDMYWQVAYYLPRRDANNESSEKVCSLQKNHCKEQGYATCLIGYCRRVGCFSGVGT